MQKTGEVRGGPSVLSAAMSDVSKLLQLMTLSAEVCQASAADPNVNRLVGDLIAKKVVDAKKSTDELNGIRDRVYDLWQSVRGLSRLGLSLDSAGSQGDIDGDTQPAWAFYPVTTNLHTSTKAHLAHLIKTFPPESKNTNTEIHMHTTCILTCTHTYAYTHAHNMHTHMDTHLCIHTCTRR